MAPVPLPIQSIRDALLTSLKTTPNFVLQAEPGAGKTTQVPLMLEAAGFATSGEIIVAQPRRLAARMAAQRVASLLGESVGQRCGYQVRFDSKVSAATRIRFVTEGLLLRRLRDDPALEGVSTVILDEFHERHISTDVALALLAALQQRRPSLRIGVMSATLDPDPVAAYLNCAPLRCQGRAFPVEVLHPPKSSDRPIPSQVSVALRELGERGLDGSVLVFLPGSGEIRACAKQLAGQAKALGLDVATLHGDLSAKEQDQTVRGGARPKLILSTNVAETSVTIDHVTAVIDSGLARKPSHNPWTGIPTLTLSKISRASAAQRAGRAGRTRPGTCMRLFTKVDHDRRPEFDAPELARLDLAAAMLDLRAGGITKPREIRWFEPPPEAAVDAAERLLQRLQALAPDGSLSTMGRAMLKHPVHPRIARLLEEARIRDVSARGATAAALLSERDIHRRNAHSGGDVRVASSDVIVAIEDFERWKRDGRSVTHTLGLEEGACRIAQQVERQLARSIRAKPCSRPLHQLEDRLNLALLAGFPDRIGRVRPGANGTLQLVFAEGGSADLDAQSAVRDSELAVALAVDERRGRQGALTTVVRSAAQVEVDALLELFVDDLEEHRRIDFDAQRERIVASDELRFGSLVVDTTALRTVPPEAAEVLFAAAQGRGIEHFLSDRDAARALEARTRFVHRLDPSVPVLDDAAAAQTLRRACEGARGFADLRKQNLLARLLSDLPPAARGAVERLAPTHVPLGGGRRLRVHYELDRDPWVESRLQDFFGAARGPTVGDGRVPLVLHLLAPNRRAVQVTTDLAGFWERHYPEQRRVLKRRYPKHDWPEKPQEASPPKPRPPRRRR